MRTRSGSTSGARQAVGRNVGRILRDLRTRKGLTQQEVSEKLTYYTDPRSIRRLEEGRRPPRHRLIVLLINGIEIDDVAIINQVLTEAQYEALSQKEEFLYNLRHAPIVEAVPQVVRWTSDYGGHPGILIEAPEREFIAWPQLKPEVEVQLLPQEARVPPNSTVATRPLHNRSDFAVRILDPRRTEIGSVWFGPDPYKKWGHDGLVRLGRSVHAGAPKKPIVWRVTQRFSDGSYRTIEAL